MPDWVTHLGTTYIATRTTLRLSPGLARWVDMRHLLLGALLPDATRFTIILVDILDWPAIPTFTYLIPFHSLLIVALLAGAIALLMPVAGSSSGSAIPVLAKSPPSIPPRGREVGRFSPLWGELEGGRRTMSGIAGSGRAFGLIMAGATLHMLLDDLEGRVGCGSTTFYPLYFGKPFNGWNTEGHLTTFLLVISAIAIGLALSQRQQWSLLMFRLTRRRVLGALVLVVIALILPLFFRTWMIERNAYYLGFVNNPAAFAGQSVELCFSEIVTTSPLTIEEFDTRFILQTPSTFIQGEWVSVRGIYQNGAIRPTTLIRHQGFSDVTLSLIAAVVFVVLLFDVRYLKLFASNQYWQRLSDKIQN